VAEIRRQLKAEAKTSQQDLKRLEKRAVELEREVSRLVKAIRTTDAPELAEEPEAVRTERQSVSEGLQRARGLKDVENIDQGRRSDCRRATRAWGRLGER